MGDGPRIIRRMGQSSIEQVANLCKRRGIVFPSSEIYRGAAVGVRLGASGGRGPSAISGPNGG